MILVVDGPYFAPFWQIFCLETPRFLAVQPHQISEMNLGASPTPISDRDDFHSLLAWVKASDRRVDILTSLADNPRNSTDFANRWDVTPEAVRYHLDLLHEGGPRAEYPALIMVVTPDRDRYRLYGLTDSGAEIVDYL